MKVILVLTAIAILVAAACEAEPSSQPSPTVTVLATRTPVVVATPPPFPTIAPTAEPTSTPTSIDADLSRRLDQAFGRWMASGGREYEMTFKWVCFCAPQTTTAARITVMDDAITSAVYAPEPGWQLPDGEPDLASYRTVLGLFDFVRDAMERDAASITAVFDPTDGHPLSAFIDFDERLADEEMGFQVTSMKYLGRDYSVLAAEAEAMRKVWVAQSGGDYDFEMRWGCFCPPEYIAPVVITVRVGAIESVRYKDTAQFAGPPDPTRYMTIEGVFDFIKQQIGREADSIKVTYEPSLGYPSQVTIDQIAMAMDDEQALTISNVVLR